jgi:S-DNA-T family DNA segregation ATPase FtsK/SpoIIIE
MANRLKTSKSKQKAEQAELRPEKEPEVKIQEVMHDDRTFKIIGAVLLMFSVFLFVAFVSYLFTWQEDMDVIRDNGTSILRPNTLKISNMLGTFGAFISFLFIYQGFGLASLFFCQLLFVKGTNMLFGQRIFKVRRHLFTAIPALFIASISLAFMTDGAEFPWGGTLGQGMSVWMTGFMGALGTAMFLGVAGLSLIIWRFNPVFKVPKLPARPVTSPETEQQSTVMPAPAENSEPEPADHIVPDQQKGNRMRVSSGVRVPLSIREDSSPTVDDPGIILKEVLPAPAPPMQDPPWEPIPTRIPAPDPKPDVRPSLQDLPQVPAAALPLQIKPANSSDLKAERRAQAENLPPYDPVLDLRDYKYPSLDLLENYAGEKIVMDQAELEANKDQIIRTLENYDIAIQKIFATVGPTVTLYEIVPAAGVRISRIKNLEDDIALSLSALGIRIIAPIPGKGTIGIEVPNVKKALVGMRGLLSSEKFQHSKFALPIALGKKIDNEHFIVDLATMPHLLMAGATGQGKSVGINAVLVSLLYRKHPSQLKFVLVDPKKVELSLYKTIDRHFLAKLPGEEDAIITDTKKVVNTLNALCIEMDNRYDLLKEAGCRNIKEYNDKFIARKLNPEKGHQFLPFIVLVIDEFADLIMTAGKEIEMPIGRLAQLARAVGIHLIIATQRPSVNIITGTIKANFPARVAFKVSSKIDSRTILDAGGAEQLIGRGDMLVSYNGEITRLQCVFVDTPEVERVVDSIADQKGYPHAFMLPEYVDDKELEAKDVDLGNRDPLFEEAARLIVQSQSGSTSLIQRRMKLGYNRAGRLMDQLEAAGVVGPNLGSKVREVMFKTEHELEQFLDSLG